MQFIIMNYYHRHKSAIIVTRVLSSSSKHAIIVIKNMLSSSSKYAIIVIKMLSFSSGIAIIVNGVGAVFFRNCYHRQWR